MPKSVNRFIPVVRFFRGPDREYILSSGSTPRPADGSTYPAFKPVDWLIDNTPLREPLFLWAGIWDVRGEFDWEHSFRLLFRAADTN